MAYATQADLVTRFGERRLIELTDRSNPVPETIDAGVVAAALADAAGLIDSYVGQVLPLPLPSAPAALTAIACDLAWYRLRGEGAAEDSPERKAFEDAIAWLKRVAAGEVSLEPEGAAAASDSDVRFAAPDRVFSRDSLKGF